MKTAVVILNYNGEKLLLKFLPLVIKYTPPDIQLIVADNASTDNSLQLLKSNFPEVKILELASNYGFAGGYNEALKKVDAEYFILLNSDIEVTPDWTTSILEFMESHQQVAACQPKILSYAAKNIFEHAGAVGGYLDFLGYPFCRGRIFNFLEEDKQQYNSNKEIFWASGACMFIRKSAFENCGGFDASFFAHMEEIDLCWRLKRAGHHLFCIPSSTVYHVGGGTLPKSNPHKTYLNFRNNLMMLYKNIPPHKLLRTFLIRMVMDKIASLKFLCTGHAKDAMAVWRAYLYFFNNFSRIKKERNLHSLPFLNVSCIYENSIVKEHFFKGVKKFNELQPDKFSSN
jgi:GT2 family glycosyltransferase